MDQKAFFDKARSHPFNGSLSQSAVEGIQALTTAFATYGDGDKRKLAYILGTAFHESDRFQTMEEYASGQAYEGRADLGNTQSGDGKRYKGRGFVQVTGRRNYTDWTRRLGIDLLADPEAAEKRPVAARICVEGMLLGTFTGKKLGDYITEKAADYIGARRTVNGTDKASLIAGYARDFEGALTTAGFGIDAVVSHEPTIHDTQAALSVTTGTQAETVIPVSIVTPPKPGLPAIIGSVNKAVGAARGAAKGAALGPAIALVAPKLGILPEWVFQPEYLAAFLLIGGVLIAGGWAFIGAYRAPANE